MARHRWQVVVSVAVLGAALGTHVRWNGESLRRALGAPPAAPSTRAGFAPTAHDALIAKLTDTDAATRDDAAAKLRAAGWGAMGSLIVAARLSETPEAQLQLENLIRDIGWNTTGMPVEEAERLKRFSADPELGRPQTSARTLRLAENALMTRWGMTTAMEERNIEEKKRSQIADMKRGGRWDELVWMHITQVDVPNLLMTLHEHPMDVGPLLRAIRALKTVSQDGWSRQADEVMMALARVGAPAELAPMARGAAQDDYVLHLAEREDWPTLSKFPVDADFFNVSRFIPASALHFSGKVDDGDKIIAGQSKSPRGVEPVGLQRQLVLLGRIELINKALVERGDTDTLVEFLLRERRYAEALTHHSSKRGPGREGKDAWPGGTIAAGGVVALGPGATMEAQIDARLLVALAKLNERERALAELKRLEAAGVNVMWLNQARKQLGLAPVEPVKELEARPGARRPIAAGPRLDQRAVSDFAWELGYQRDAAREWAELAFLFTNDTEKAIEIANAVMRDAVSAEDLFRLTERAVRSTVISSDKLLAALADAPPRLERLERHDLAMRALATFFEALGESKNRKASQLRALPEIAKEMLSVANPELPKTFFDGMLTQADCDLGIRYYAGLFSLKNGDAQTGKKRIADAEFLIGGDLNFRRRIFRELVAMGEMDYALRQAEVLIKIAPAATDARYDAHMFFARREQANGRHEAALRQYRLAFYAQFAGRIRIPEPYEEFFRLPRDAAFCESMVALGKDDVARMVRRAKDVLQLDPEGLDLTLQLIDVFKKKNLVEQARALAAGNRAFLEGVLKDFPNSHLHHFLIARLDVGSGFSNEQTGGHLRKARELAPGNKEYQALQER